MFKSRILKSLVLWGGFSFLGMAADRGDFYSHLFFGWDFTLQSRTGGATLGYHPWNELGFGISFDQSQDFSAPGLDIRWLIEPFEVVFNPQYAFWSEKGGDWFFQLGAGFNYLGQITSRVAWFLSLRAYFPEQKSRSFFTGLGTRFIF
ncbi:hypothetical protein GW915_08160 [bacterium]|nr:hypothetical protein [bacterium]